MVCFSSQQTGKHVWLCRGRGRLRLLSGVGRIGERRQDAETPLGYRVAGAAGVYCVADEVKFLT